MHWPSALIGVGVGAAGTILARWAYKKFCPRMKKAVEEGKKAFKESAPPPKEAGDGTKEEAVANA